MYTQISLKNTRIVNDTQIVTWRKLPIWVSLLGLDLRIIHEQNLRKLKSYKIAVNIKATQRPYKEESLGQMLLPLCIYIASCGFL